MADRHDRTIDGESVPAAESNGHDMSGADQDYLAASANRAVQDTAAFLEAAVRLEAMKTQNRIAEKKYNQELLSLQSRFREYLARIDDRSAVLRKSLQQVNTARNHEELKKGLLSLMDNDSHLISKEELEDLNQQIWKADDATILSWRNDKFYVPINRKKPKPILGFIQNKTPKDRYCTEDLAQCAYSMLYQAVCFATEEQVPILLDY